METFYILSLLFFSYSFLGWIIELIVIYYETHKLINRGFLIGPIVPIYGVGSLIIYLFLSRYNNDPIVLFLLSIIVCAGLEYFTSYIMEKIFKNRWWDYSDKKYNINGRVCLENAILFGIGAILSVYYINPILINFYSNLSYSALQITSAILTVLFIIDCAVSFNIIITLKNISSTIKSDSTEVITKKVHERLGKMIRPYRRLLEAFPEMKVFNKMALLKEKITSTKDELKREKKDQNKRRYYR